MIRGMRHTSEAPRLLRELDAELASASEHAGRSLVWTPQDRARHRLLSRSMSRKTPRAMLGSVDPPHYQTKNPRVSCSAASPGHWVADGPLPKDLRRWALGTRGPRQVDESGPPSVARLNPVYGCGAGFRRGFWSRRMGGSGRSRRR